MSERLAVHEHYDVLIIGAGLAGLTAATELKQAGKQVCVLDKSRGPGGRMSTRVQGAQQWDHGAQYFTARSAAFRQQLATWLALGVVAPWDTAIGAWEQGQLTATAPLPRYVGVPGMKSPLQALASTLNIYFNHQVTSLEKHSQLWRVHTLEQTFSARQLVLALPAPQAAALLPPDSAAFALANAVVMQPCWALMLATSSPLALPFSGIFVNEGPVAWVAADSSKPGRATFENTWVVHASAEWTAAHLEHAPEAITALLIDEFNHLLKRWQPHAPTPHWHYAKAHRWRYARGAVEGRQCVWPDEGLALAGDWLAGGKVEGAFLAGMHCAQHLIQSEPQ